MGIRIEDLILWANWTYLRISQIIGFIFWAWYVSVCCYICADIQCCIEECASWASLAWSRVVAVESAWWADITWIIQLYVDRVFWACHAFSHTDVIMEVFRTCCTFFISYNIPSSEWAGFTLISGLVQEHTTHNITRFTYFLILIIIEFLRTCQTFIIFSTGIFVNSSARLAF